MHTAFSIDAQMFRVEIDGVAADREQLLNWDSIDRLGVVMAEPLGAIGASLTVQLAITCYFDCKPSRR